MFQNQLFQNIFFILTLAKNLFCYPGSRMIKGASRMYRHNPFYFRLAILVLFLYIYLLLIPSLPPAISSQNGLIFYPHRDTVKIVSYSLGCNYFRSRGIKGSCKERLSSLILEATDYDIVLLQEIYMFHFGPFYLDGNIHLLNKELYNQGFLYRTAYRGTMKYPFLSQNNGLASFSRFPIGSSKSTVFRCSSMLEYPTGQGFEILHIPLKTPNTSAEDVFYLVEDGKPKTFKERSLYLLNVNLDGHKPNTRSCQLRELLAFVTELPADSFIVISGNLNIDSLNGDLSEYEALQHSMGYLGLMEVFDDSRATHREGSHYDYVFVSKNIKVLTRAIRNLRTSDGEPVSDHFGLFINLQLSEH